MERLAKRKQQRKLALKRIGTNMDSKISLRQKGTKVITQKSIKAKQDIQKLSRDFDDTLSDVDCIRLIGITRHTYYKYKAELKSVN